MQFITNAFTNLSKATDTIISFISFNFPVDKKFHSKIKNNIHDFFKPLKKDLNVFIEYPYVDKVYRDSYYTYFSTKYKPYPRDSIRLSFFSSEVKGIHQPTDHRFLEEHFMGYCTIRPTFPDVIGRNLLSKKALLVNDFETCIHKENSMVNGIKLHVKGFPHSSQDQESITCAETTIWAMMEYFGHKYAEYKPVLPSSIINKLDQYSDKRMLPSSGLTPEQVSYALKDFGFGTLIYTKKDDKDFFSNLAVYIESGFPLIVVMENDDFAHAILMIGREKFKNADLIQALQKSNEKITPFSSLIQNYIVQDDNLPPYSLTPLDSPATNYGSDSPFATCKITAFIVPLYRKMYMEVEKARSFFNAIFNDPQYGIRTRQKHIFRMYMASSRSFKEHIAKQTVIDGTLRKVLLAVAMPRFIWCGEYINSADAARRTVSSLIVLDATEAGENWADSFIFAAHKSRTLFYGVVNQTLKLIPLELPFAGFLMYEHNLN